MALIQRILTFLLLFLLLLIYLTLTEVYNKSKNITVAIPIKDKLLIMLIKANETKKSTNKNQK